MFARRNFAVRPVLGIAGLAVATSLAMSACSSSSSKSTPSTGSSSSSSDTASSTTSATGGAGALSKADFLTQANKVCAGVNTKLATLPKPTSPKDFTNIIGSLNGTTSLFGPYLTQVGKLASQTADADELQSKWIGPETKELTAFKAAAEKVVADARAKDAAKVQTDSQAISQTQTGAASIASYLNGYGLSECAQLETS